MPATENRDLASGQLWEDSLHRSRRRRRQAAHARKEQNRRKTASLAVSAAVVAAPMWPSVAGSGRFEAKADAAAGLKPRDARERVLLSFGDTGPAVASLQHKLGIVEDGIFGPQTEAAVRAFQKRTKLPVTGDVDVRTWLSLFPNDAIVAASGTGSSGEPQWAALSTQPADSAPAATVPASVSATTEGGPLTQPGGDRAAPGKRAKAAKANAAPTSLLPEPADSPDEAPTGDGLTPAAQTPEDPAKGAPAPVGGQAPSGGQGTPRPVPVPRPVVPLTPGGSFNEMIQKMIDEANRIDRARYSYRWGGGHNSRFTGPYDCSGAVSAVLHAAGLLKSPMVSGDFTRWGAPGKGLVTIYANSSHVYMSIKGRFFGTSRSNPGGGAGWFRGAPRRGFVVVHVPFERMKPRKRDLTRARAVKPRKRVQVRAPSSTPRYVSHGDSVTGGTTTGAPRQPAAAPAPVAPAAPPVSAPAPVAGQAPAGSTGQMPPAPAQPAPVTVKTPVGPVSVPPVPSSPAGPQGPSGSGSAPPSSGSAPSGSAPASGPAPGAQPPSAPVPAPGSTGTTAQPGSPGPPAGSSSPAPTPAAPTPASGGPVSELGGQVVSGAGDAVGEATSKLAPAQTQADAAEASAGAGRPELP